MKERLPFLIFSVFIMVSAVFFIRRQDCGSEEDNTPAGWVAPPLPGEDPDYQGPDPAAPMKYSPYAIDADDRVRRRPSFDDNGDPGMAEAIAAVIEGIDGDIGYLGERRDDRFALVESRIRTLPAGRFRGDDAEAVGQELLDDGLSFLLVSTRHPRPQLWMQNDAAGLRVRLRDALPLSHFHPLLFGRSHILYRIAPPMELDEQERLNITRWVRERLSGREPGELGIERSTASVGRSEHRVIIALRAHRLRALLGRRLMTVSESGETLQDAFEAAAVRMIAEWPAARARAQQEQDVETSESLAEFLTEAELDIEVVDRMCRFVHRDRQQIYWQFEIGLEGVYVEHNDEFSFLSPAMPVWRADQYYVRRDGRRRRRRHFAGTRTTVETLMERNNLHRRAWRTPSDPGRAHGPYLHDFGRFDTHGWIEREAGGEIVSLYRGVPLVTVAEVTRERLVEALHLGGMWLVQNQLDDGQFRYKYEPLNVDPDDRWISGNNIVRHALNPYTLLLANRAEPDPRLLASARRGMAYTLEHLRREGNRCYIWHQDVPADYENAKMGTVAVTMLSILAMADSEGVDISEYEDVLRCLAEELLYMQDPNGHFRQYDVPRDHPYYGAENSIFPGEMLLALARMYEYSEDERFRESFARGFEWYRQWWAENVDNRTRGGIYTEEDRVNLLGFVPWNVMALNEMHRLTNEERYADFAFELQDWIDSIFFYDPERTPYADYLGAYYKHHWEPPAINSNGYTEGAAAAYALALRTGRDVERRRQTLVLGIRFALQLQYESYDTTFFLPDPRTAMGGFHYHLTRTRSRNDYSYHAMSALAQALEFLPPEDYPAETPIPLPRTLDAALGQRDSHGSGATEGDAGPPAGESLDGGLGDGGSNDASVLSTDAD